MLERWPEFRRRHREELRSRPATRAVLDELHPHPLLLRGRTTFVYRAHDERHNSARVLKEFLKGGP